MSDQVLQQGSSGDEVIELQTHLQQLNFYAGNVDGEFGFATEAAVSAYREWGGLGYGVEADEQVRLALAGHIEQYSQPEGAAAGQEEYAGQWGEGYDVDGAQPADAAVADPAVADPAVAGTATRPEPKATPPIANQEIDGAETDEAPAPELDEFANSQ